MGRGRAWRRKHYFKRRDAWLRRAEAEDKKFYPRGPDYGRALVVERPWWSNSVAAAKRAVTPAWCSCAGCGGMRGNKHLFRRKVWRTKQERRSDDAFRAQLDDLRVDVWRVRRFPWCGLRGPGPR